MLLDSFGIKRGFASTVHSYTNDQPIQDFPHKDLRRARAGAVSMIPTTTGAATAVGLVLPELKGKLDGIAIRVPTANVSVVDLTVELGKSATPAAVNDAFRAAAAGPLKGILDATDEELVSVDFNGNPHSSIVDLPSTAVVDGNLVKVLAWYDNEWGYSCRVRDLIRYMARVAVAGLAAAPPRPWRSSSSISSTWPGSASSCGPTSTCPWRAAGSTDDTRIAAVLPTIEHCLKGGRRADPRLAPRPPEGQAPDRSTRFARWPRGSASCSGARSLWPRLRGARGRAAARALRPGDVVLLENLRFHAEEEANDDGFARQLAALADVYVNDAFAAAHRAHASIAAHRPPSQARRGGPAHGRRARGARPDLRAPRAPGGAVLGGAKVSDKLGPGRAPARPGGRAR